MHRFWGYLSIMIATVLLGLWTSFSKILLNYLDPVVLSALVYTIGGGFLFLLRFSPLNHRITSLLNQDSYVESFVTRKEYGILIITAVFGSFLAPLTYLYGLEQITAVNASLLINVEILFVVVLGIFFLKEHFVKQDILGFLFIIVGTVFLATNGQLINFPPGQVIGSLLIVLAAFMWSIDTILSKYLSVKQDIVLISAVKCSIGGIFLLVLSLLFGQSFALPVDKLPYLFFIGIVIEASSFILVLFAIREIGSTRTGSLFSLASLFGAVFAFLILKESFTFLQLFFGFLMLVGVYIFYKNEK
jgi:drug/metabolite transporter (DMT)-like permease